MRTTDIMQSEELASEQDEIDEFEGGKGESVAHSGDNLYERSSSDHELDRDSREPSALAKALEEEVQPINSN